MRSDVHGVLRYSGGALQLHGAALAPLEVIISLCRTQFRSWTWA